MSKPRRVEIGRFVEETPGLRGWTAMYIGWTRDEAWCRGFFVPESFVLENPDIELAHLEFVVDDGED